jgi:hypothetical protein
MISDAADTVLDDEREASGKKQSGTNSKEDFVYFWIKGNPSSKIILHDGIDITVGRQEGQTFRISDDKVVSKQHLVLIREKNLLRIEVKGANGLKFDGRLYKPVATLSIEIPNSFTIGETVCCVSKHVDQNLEIKEGSSSEKDEEKQKSLKKRFSMSQDEFAYEFDIHKDHSNSFDRGGRVENGCHPGGPISAFQGRDCMPGDAGAFKEKKEGYWGREEEREEEIRQKEKLLRGNPLKERARGEDLLGAWKSREESSPEEEAPFGRGPLPLGRRGKAASLRMGDLGNDENSALDREHAKSRAFSKFAAEDDESGALSGSGEEAPGSKSKIITSERRKREAEKARVFPPLEKISRQQIQRTETREIGSPVIPDNLKAPGSGKEKRTAGFWAAVAVAAAATLMALWAVFLRDGGQRPPEPAATPGAVQGGVPGEGKEKDAAIPMRPQKKASGPCEGEGETYLKMAQLAFKDGKKLEAVDILKDIEKGSPCYAEAQALLNTLGGEMGRANGQPGGN